MKRFSVEIPDKIFDYINLIIKVEGIEPDELLNDLITEGVLDYHPLFRISFDRDETLIFDKKNERYKIKEHTRPLQNRED